MADDIILPLIIPAGSTILGTAPLKWREPSGVESTLRRVYWADNGWCVEVDSVSVAADCTVSVGSIEDERGEDDVRD